MSKPILVFWIMLVLTIAPGLAAAQDSCFPHDVAVVQTDAHVRESSDFVSRAVQDAKPGDIFSVTGSTQDGGRCWIETSAGWLYIGYVKPESAPALTPQATATATSSLAAHDAEDEGDNCYPLDVATITYKSSLMAAAHHIGTRLGYAEPGATYQVKSSRQNGGYCWVETDAGWVVSRAVAEIPPTTTEATLPLLANLPQKAKEVSALFGLDLQRLNPVKESITVSLLGPTDSDPWSKLNISANVKFDGAYTLDEIQMEGQIQKTARMVVADVMVQMNVNMAKEDVTIAALHTAASQGLAKRKSIGNYTLTEKGKQIMTGLLNKRRN